ncbi:MFS transporter [Devosia honganensis]|uniref:MFS transporter n=1 Tax=Devosia honganensis TaxID=1610527 RepID=A0ABV7X418_9HYPH
MTGANAQSSGDAAYWNAVICLSLLAFTVSASEFLPANLLTPIANDLGITEGQLGQAISVSGLFAIATSLLGNSLLTRLDRRIAVMMYTGALVLSGVAITFAPNYLVFIIGRALIGITVGGFWSLSTAILARLVTSKDLPKAITILQGGGALAALIAIPLGAFLAGLIGWRAAFFMIVPIGITGLIWQAIALPAMPASHTVSVRRMFGLFHSPIFAIGMTAVTLAFMGRYAMFTYVRPFLEGVTGMNVNGLSLMLFGIGIAGLIGTIMAGFVLRNHLRAALIGLPVAMAVISLTLVPTGHIPSVTVILLLLWGLLANPIPVAWFTWIARVVPNDMEAAGGLQVALIQFAITFGAAGGGLLFDITGWWSPFVLAALLLGVAAAFAAKAAPSNTKGGLASN